MDDGPIEIIGTFAPIIEIHMYERNGVQLIERIGVTSRVAPAERFRATANFQVQVKQGHNIVTMPHAVTFYIPAPDLSAAFDKLMLAGQEAVNGEVSRLRLQGAIL